MLYSKIRGKTERVESRHDRLDLNLRSHGNIVPPYHPFITMMQKTDHRKGWVNWIWQIKSWSYVHTKMCKQKAHRKCPRTNEKKAALWYHTEGVCSAGWKKSHSFSPQRNRFLGIMRKYLKTYYSLIVFVKVNSFILYIAYCILYIAVLDFSKSLSWNQIL